MSMTKQIIVAAWVLILGCFFIQAQPFVITGPFGPGASGGGTTVNNTYVLTNASGNIYAFQGALSNGIAAPPNGNSTVYAPNGQDMGILQSNTAPLVPGTYGYFQVTMAGATLVSAGTNVDFVFVTNSPNAYPAVSTGIKLTFIGGSALNTLVNTNTVIIPSNTLGGILITNNTTSSIRVVASWSMGQQIPSSALSLNTTNTVSTTNITVVTGSIPVTNKTFSLTSTNTLTLSGWPVAFLNINLTWNSAYNIDGSGGAYTNGHIVYFFDAGGSFDGPFNWILASNDLGQVYSVMSVATAPVVSSNEADVAIPGTINSGGNIVYQSTSVTNTGSFVANMTLPNTVQIYVATDGWTSATGWVNETSAGQSLQDALNYWFNGQSQVGDRLQGSGSALSYTAFYFTTNFYGGTLQLGPAPPWVNPFYLPQGFVIHNENGSAAWRITGQGPNTCIVGDSNVLANFVTTNNNLGGPMPLEEIDHVSLCVSNAAQKVIAVNLNGNGYLNFDRNYITAYVAWNPTNYSLGWVGGDSAGTHVPIGYSPGFIDLVVCGNNGEQRIYDNVIADGACGALCLAEHQRWKNNEFKLISWNNGAYASQWKTNDATVVAIGDSGTIFGYDIALGPMVIMAGQGDLEMSGDKAIAPGVGIEFKDSADVLYGPSRLYNVHFEALLHKTNDIILPNTSSTTVEIEDCFDQQTIGANSGDANVGVYSFNTSTFVLSSSSGFGNNKAIVSGLVHSANGGAFAPALLINNSPVYTWDPNNSTFTENWIAMYVTNVTLGAGLIMNSESAAAQIPPYAGTATNWWIGVVGGAYERIATNNGAGTTTTIKF